MHPALAAELRAASLAYRDAMAAIDRVLALHAEIAPDAATPSYCDASDAQPVRPALTLVR